jgi:gliding motility-associated-like protein
MKKSLLFSAVLALLASTLTATEKPPVNKWAFKSPFEQKVFIENLGQYAIREKALDAKDVVFGTRQDGLRYFFTKDGLWIMNYKPVKRTEKEVEAELAKYGVKEDKKMEKNERHWLWKFVPEYHQMQFVGANPNVQVYGENEQSTVHNFHVGGQNVVAHGWKKLIYKNLYPGVDMELYFPEDKTGFKYTFILQPGVDPSVIQIKYPENEGLKLSKDGNVVINSTFGAFTDHAPVANEAQTAKPVDCSFTLKKGIVQFNVGSYDATKSLIIDPFTATPSFSGSNSAFDVDWDNAGNCYVYGGVAPFQVLKFNAAGTLLWTYTTTFSFAWYYGDFAVDRNSGASYITDGFNGSGAQAIKINGAGAQVAFFNGNSLFQEMWRIAFSKCTNQAVIAGGGTSNPSYTGCYLDTNLANMAPVNVINSPTGLHDMWGIALDAFGFAYFATAQTQVGSPGYDNIIYKVPTPALTPILWQMPEGYQFIEVASVNYAPGPPNGFNGMSISNSSLYTYDSYVLKKWSTATGAMTSSLNVSGSSISTMTYGGLTTDDCDNIFVGVNSTIRQYNSALSLVATIAAPAAVYDCELGRNNILYSCGNGFVMSTQVNLQPCSILQVTQNVTNAGCGTLGSATITVSGGTSPYTINWNTTPPQSGPVLTGVPTGTYIATITDNSCIKQTTYDTVIITGGGGVPMVVNSGSVCPGGSLTLVCSGASSYTWSPSTGLNTVNSATVIATPSVTTTYTVTGAQTGCNGTAIATVTVNPLPVIAVNSSTICAGQQTATLTANGASTYAWSPATGLSVTTGSVVNATPAATTTYTITGTDAAGCVNTGTAAVLVNPLPNVTAVNNPACLGTTLTMSTSVGVSWNWSGPNSFTSAVQSPSINNVTTAANGTYTVTATDANGCYASATLSITVTPLPNTTAGSNSPLCVNQNLTLNAGGGSTYSWNGPNSYTSTAQNPLISGVTTAAAGVYTVTITDANNCTATNTVSVTVNPLPVVTATGATVCANATINLASTGGVGYSWNGPGGYSSNLQNPGINGATSANSGNYVVTVTDANGCVNANVAQVVVNNLPVISVNSGVVCMGQTTATLTASGASTYNWTPTTGLSAGTGSTVVANPASATSYTVTGTDLNGCVSTATTNVTVNPVPQVAVSPLTASGCAPLCVTFVNTTSATGNCSWAFGDGQSSNSCAPTHCFTGQGTFNAVLSLTDNNGCVGTSTASVVVYPVPDANFNATPQPTTILDPTIHFYDATSGATINTWNWTFGDPLNNGSTTQNPTFQYQAVGQYQVMLTVTSNMGCVDSVIKIIKIDDEFMLYVPNAFSPNDDGVNETFMAKGEGIRDFKMYIFDRWGNLTYLSDDINKGWNGRKMGKSDDVIQEDVYVWKIELKNFKGESRQFHGIVNLIK